MKFCPECGGLSRSPHSDVLDTGEVFRRRTCEKCGFQYTTAEGLVKQQAVVRKALGGARWREGRKMIWVDEKDWCLKYRRRGTRV